MGTEEGDRDFFKGLEEQMEGAAPGRPQKLERLNFEQLGRSIVIKAEDNGQDELAKVDSLITRTESLLQGKPPNPQGEQPPREENKDYLIGYILPIQVDQKRHVLIFKTGTILVTEPSTDYYEGSDRREKEYREYCIPNDYPLGLSSHWGKNATEVENKFFIRTPFKVVLSNKNPNDLPKISEAMSQALSFANELKTSREKAKQDSVQDLMKQLDSFFGNGESKGPSTGQPPPPPPPLGSGPTL